MKQYLDLLDKTLKTGERRSDRTGVGTISLFGAQSRYDLSKNFPLLTTKKIFLKAVIYELLWFLKGDTNVKYLNNHGVGIWDEWADKTGELGPIYGKQWTAWKANNGAKINQIKQVKLQLSRKPRCLPRIRLNPKVKNIFKFNYEDFEVINYNPYLSIKASIAI